VKVGELIAGKRYWARRACGSEPVRARLARPQTGAAQSHPAAAADLEDWITVSTDDTKIRPDRNLALELVRVTEAAAMAAARMIGRGDKEAADQAAVDAMRHVLDGISMDGLVVIGEGEKDEAPMLYNGEHIGDGHPPLVDIAVDPLEGTRLTALGMPSAITVIALAERGAMFDPGPCVYMEKLAGGPKIADLLDLERPLPETLKLIAQRKGVDIRDVIVVMLDRERHHAQMAAVREAGARVRLILDGDVSAALLAVSENSSVDVLWGIGGTPEGVISAAAVKCIGGQILGRLWARDEDERARAEQAGYELDRVLTAEDLVRGEDVFFSATGVTDGDVLQGVRYPDGDHVTTESLVMRARSGTVRRVTARHDRVKLRARAGGLYG
jgi:fructose-1,6-bisphosphatase II